MQNSAPLLSVVVAVYNGEAFLDQFFTCLVNQRIDSQGKFMNMPVFTGFVV